MTTELRCHYCNSETQLSEWEGPSWYWAIRCRNPDCLARGPQRPTKTEAIACYKQNAPSTMDLQEATERLVSACRTRHSNLVTAWVENGMEGNCPQYADVVLSLMTEPK